MKQGYLILGSGEVFAGKRFGQVEGDILGEMVFTTAMSGYVETLTDPSYYGLMVVQTFPLIGNVGVMQEDFEHPRPWLSGYIVRDLCDVPSNFRSEGTLENMLETHDIPGFCCEDTRGLTRILRTRGAVNAMLTDSPTLTQAQALAIKTYRVQGAVETVSRRETTAFSEGKRHVVLLDFGTKANIASCLAARDCAVTIVPAATPYADILALKPDGVLLSNGPGDPADNPLLVRTAVQLLKSGIPTMGICLGHQIMALAVGGRTRKMKFGHRGENQPVQHMETGRVYVTSQNHGYCVVEESLGTSGSILYRNVNDGSCEGLRYANAPAFSIQFHPEACGGPLDTEFIFDEFIALMDKEGGANA